MRRQCDVQMMRVMKTIAHRIRSARLNISRLCSTSLLLLDSGVVAGTEVSVGSGAVAASKLLRTARTQVILRTGGCTVISVATGAIFHVPDSCTPCLKLKYMDSHTSVHFAKGVD